MILTLGYRGVFRQAQYETVTIEASISLDTDKDKTGSALTREELADLMTADLGTLIRPLTDRAAQASQYDETETVLYQWKGFTDAASDTPPPGRAQRRVRRGS